MSVPLSLSSQFPPLLNNSRDPSTFRALSISSLNEARDNKLGHCRNDRQCVTLGHSDMKSTNSLLRSPCPQALTLPAVEWCPFQTFSGCHMWIFPSSNFGDQMRPSKWMGPLVNHFVILPPLRPLYLHCRERRHMKPQEPFGDRINHPHIPNNQTVIKSAGNWRAFVAATNKWWAEFTFALCLFLGLGYPKVFYHKKLHTYPKLHDIGL